MTLRIQQLIDLWGQPCGASLDPQQPVGAIITDSRRMETGGFFVPLVGERFDGHAYLEQITDSGAQAAVVSRHWDQPLPEGLLHWRVDDTLDAYQLLAREHRRALALPLVAVTGSAGKTTTRELIRATLSSLGPLMASEGNNNNDIGVPLTLLQAEPSHGAVVVEMGMRGRGEIARLSRCAEPDVAVITNIGTAHIGRLGSREAIAAAKCEITAALHPDGVVVIPAGDPLLETALAEVWTGRVLRVRLKGDAAQAADLTGELTAEHLVFDGHSLALPLPGRHNARNLLLAVAVARELGVADEALTDLRVKVPGGRNRRLHQGGLTVLDESYNASPEAVLAALDLLAVQPGRRFAVLGTMLELGDRSVELHAAVAARAAELALDGLVLVAADPEAAAMAAAAAALDRLAVVSTPDAAAEPLRHWLQSGDVVLLKASRGVALERLLPLLPSL
jgi:UDP-N-acetylmuramoyl-tripeptide--D-alanyl-D-alanine ligase